MNNCFTKFHKLFNVLALIAVCALIFYAGWYTEGIQQEQRAYRILRESCIGVPEPEQCALCGEGIPYHAPCLVDLSTGEVGELTVYTNHPTKPGELAPAEMQQTGTLRFLHCAGLMAVQDTCDHTCKVTLPAMGQILNPAHFCKGCRVLLAGAGLKQHVIVDLHDLPCLQVYPIRKGKRVTIGDYQVTMTAGEDNTLEVCVTGMVEF